MKRIEPTHIVEVVSATHTRFMTIGLWFTLEQSNDTIAIFLIKPQTTSLTERMERRRKNNIPNYNLLTN